MRRSVSICTRSNLVSVGLFIASTLAWVGSGSGETVAVVTNRLSDSLSVIDLEARVVTGDFTVGAEPIGVAVDRKSRWVYVANSGSESVTRVDIVGGATETLSLPGSIPEDVAVTPDGRLVLVSSLENIPFGLGTRGRVYILSATSFNVIDSVLVDDDPEGLSISQDSRLAWTASDEKVQEINLEDGPAFLTVSDVITGAAGMDDYEHLTAAPDKSSVFVTNTGQTEVQAVDLASETVIDTETSGAEPEDIVLRPGFLELHVTNQGAGSVTVMSASPLATIATINLSQAEPRGLAFSFDGEDAYVVCAASDTVVQYDATTRMEIGVPIAVGDFPEEIAIFDPIPPSAPAGLSAFGGDSSVDLDWDDNPETDVIGYKVYRAEAPGGPYTSLTPAAISTSSFQDVSTLMNGNTYFYVVTAVDEGANESGFSLEETATPQAPAAVEQWRLYE